MKAHAGKVKLRPALEELTRDARELAATEAFEKEKVRAAMLDAGKAGLVSCLVGPKGCINVRETAAAKAIVAWLQAEGFSPAWEARQTETKPGADTTFDLLVTWRA